MKCVRAKNCQYLPLERSLHYYYDTVREANTIDMNMKNFQTMVKKKIERITRELDAAKNYLARAITHTLASVHL